MQINKKIITMLLAGLAISNYPTLSFADKINELAGISMVETANTKKIDATTSDAIGNMLLQSVSLMGIAYKWGGNTPDTGMDCSGFVRYVFKNSLGINLPRTSAEMAKVGKRVSIDELEPGDLIFFNTRRGSNTHIGIYLGNNKFIQSPKTGETIKISELDGWWRKHFNGAKRVVQENIDDNGATVVENYEDIRDEALPTVHYKKRYSKQRKPALRKRKKPVHATTNKSRGKPVTSHPKVRKKSTGRKTG